MSKVAHAHVGAARADSSSIDIVYSLAAMNSGGGGGVKKLSEEGRRGLEEKGEGTMSYVYPRREDVG